MFINPKVANSNNGYYCLNDDASCLPEIVSLKFSLYLEPKFDFFLKIWARFVQDLVYNEQKNIEVKDSNRA